MRVLMDGSLFASAPSGGAYRYLLELMRRLPRPDVSVEILSPRTAIPIQAPAEVRLHRDRLPSGSWFPEGRAKDLLRRARGMVHSRLTRASLGSLDNSVYHSVYYVPTTLPGNLPQVFTFHDMISELFTEFADEPHNVAARGAKKS